MSLKKLERALERLNIEFARFDTGNGLQGDIASMRYKGFRYPADFIEEQHGYVTVLCPLPSVEIEIKNREELLRYLEREEKGFAVTFHEKGNHFSVGTYLAPGSYEEDLERFQATCDMVIPMLVAIGHFGIWNTNLVDLMLAPPETLPQT